MFVVTENDTGEVHKYGNLTEYRNYVNIRDSEKRRDPDLVEWDGTLSGKDTMAMTDEELRQSMNDPNSPNGYIQ